MIISLLKLWHRYRLLIFIITLISSILLGLIVIGPIFDSPAYQWIREESNKFPLIKGLIDIEGMLLEKLINSTFPLFCVWSLVLYIYGTMSDIEAKNINKAAPILSYFTSGTGTIFSFWGGLIIGLCIYGTIFHQFSPPIFAFLVYGSLFIVIGIWMRKAARPTIKGRPWLHRHAYVLGSIFAVLAISAYIYGLIAEPIQLWKVIRAAYPLR